MLLSGTTFPVLTIALAYLPSLWVAFFRMLFAFPAIVLSALLLPRSSEPRSTRDRLRAIALGVPSLGTYCAFAIVGLATAPPGSRRCSPVQSRFLS